jgi:hypothetical protein
MSNLQDGCRYDGRPTGVASVYENQNGNLILCMEIEVEGEHLRWYAALATAKDGVNTKTIERLKQMFEWDGIDPFWFVDHGADYTERAVVATIEIRPGTANPEKMFANIKFLDPPGGMGGGEVPESGDRNALLAKYGGKFRAVAGGVPAKPAPKAPPKAPPSKAPPTAPPSGKTSDQITVWQRFCELGGTDKDWFGVLAEAVPGVDQGDFTPAQWGIALDHIDAKTIPY